VTGDDGRYRFVTTKPELYPWRTRQRLAAGAHPLLAVRAGLHAAAGDADALPGRPTVPPDPIYNAIRDERVRRRLVSSDDHTVTRSQWATEYRFDIVLGAEATPFETEAG
jgi:protocatechuate 3,4-dioxygenase beta subunit